jgi:hypothetical protein
MKKLDMVKGGLELMVTIGVGTLVGGAIAIARPAKLGVVKQIAVSAAGLVVTSMATDGVTDYFEKKFDEVVTVVKELLEKRKPKEETVEAVEAQAKA